MHCPFCSHEDTRVTDSRLADNGCSIRRRRECSACKKRFWTFERYESTRLLVIKKDGRREEFDRNKILSGVTKACRKRPVDPEAIEDMVASLERDLRASGDVEFSSVSIGERIMERLIDLDEVAYVRFASVYKDFKDVNRFSEELRALAEMRKRFVNEEKK